MVILWTQLDGDNQDPAERLAQESPEIDSGNKNGVSLEHPKVDGRPPSGKIPSKGKSGRLSLSPTTSPKNFLKKKAKYFRRSKSLPSRGSHRQVVSVKAVEFPVQVATPQTSPESISSKKTQLLDLSNGISPGDTSSCSTEKPINLTDALKVSHISNEMPTRVTISRNGTIKKESAPNFVMESDDDVGTENNFERKKSKRKFYTLPRNWKSQAVDLFRNKGKTLCEHCKKKCSGEVLRVHDNYYHIACFSCSNCKKSLAHGGFFSRDSNFFCTECYHEKFGQQCATCGKYVEGEVVSALGNTYHQKCFLCARCRQPFPSGERVTYTGKECLCQKCYQIPVVDSLSPARSPTSDAPKCAGCKQELVEGQALIALDQQWHIWCFKCACCNTLLHGEYMGKDGLPYCEKDYQNQFGVKCAYCDRFITGKVLQAGDNHHFHPTCARCTKCGDPFGDGEEMYLQGTAIWHPRCGPGPTENGTVINGSLTNGHHHLNGDHQKMDRDLDGMSSTASETQFSRSCTPSLNGSLRSNSPYNSLNRKFSGPYRTCSPGLILREYKSSHSPIDISRIYTYSYLAAEPTQSYLKKPIDPYDRPPKSPHFHRPPNDTRRVSLPKASSRLGMRVLVETIQSETPRPKSPKMNNEEPIILSHYPGAKPPKEGQPSRIERDDFPAPPYPYTDPERRRRWSGSSKGVSVDEVDDEEDEVDYVDPKLKKEEEELSKISTGIGKVFLQQVKEREKMQAWKASHVDPRNASRTPSAKQELGYRMRFESATNASPSRFTDHSRPWEEDEFEPVSSFRCSTGRSSTTFPNYSVVSSRRGEPKPGYGLKSSTLPMSGRNGGTAGVMGDYHHYGGAIGNKTHSTDFSSARSDVSACSLTEADRTALNPELCPSATYSSNLRGYSYSPHFRRSLPNMHHMASDPPKIYPAHLLVTCNYRLPNDVDRCHLERHLSDTDFELIFRMTRLEFYRQPEWKRNDLKRRARLF